MAPDNCASETESAPSDAQRLAVPRELEIAAAGDAAADACARSAFPVHGANPGARVELLIVEQRLQRDVDIAGANTKRHRILDRRPRRTPASLRDEIDVAGRERARYVLPVAICAARPERAA